MNSLEGILHVNVDVVADKLRAVAIVFAVEANGANEGSSHLRHGDPSIFYFIWQSSQYLGDAVLYVYSSDVERTGQLEDDRNRTRSVVSAGRSHIAHAFHAVDRFLQNRGDRGFDSLRVCTHI